MGSAAATVHRVDLRAEPRAEVEACRERDVGDTLPGQRATRTSLGPLGQHVCLSREEMPGSWARCKPAGSVRGGGKDVAKENGSCTHDLPSLGPSLDPSMTQHGLSQKFYTLFILTFTFLWLHSSPA